MSRVPHIPGVTEHSVAPRRIVHSVWRLYRMSVGGEGRKGKGRETEGRHYHYYYWHYYYYIRLPIS